MTIRFYLDYSRYDGFRKLKFVVSEHGEQKGDYLDVFVDPEKWDQKNQSHKDRMVNELLDSVRDRFAQLRNEAIRFGHYTSVDYYLSRFKESPKEAPIKDPKKNDNLVDYIDSYWNRMKKLRSNNHLRGLKQVKTHLSDSGLDVSFGSLSNEFWIAYQDYLVTQDIQNVTIKNHLKFIKIICKDALSHGYLVNPSYNNFSIKIYKGKPVWLYADELKVLANGRFDRTDQIVADDFLARAYTGLRNSDMAQVDEHHFQKHKGDWFFYLTIEKTGNVLTIPIHPKAIEIFEKYDFRIPQFSLQHKNRRMKFILRRLKINRMTEHIRYVGQRRIVELKPLYKAVSSHTARRTFGRKWMEDVGDIYKLSQIYGHTEVKTTMIYIGLENIDLSRSVRMLKF